MSELRFNFLNWKPDVEDEGNDGLTVADNVLHDAEGYKPISDWSQTGTTYFNSGTSCHIRPAGSADNLITARVEALSASTAMLAISPPYLSVAYSGTAATATLTGLNTGGPLAAKVIAFQVCELADKVFVTAVAEGSTSASTTALAYATGYITYP